MKLTAHFSSEEFDLPPKLRGGKLFPYVQYPLEWIDDRLRPLCEALEILRTSLGNKPITVVSGYRTPEYNALIGGVVHSQHLEGRAADIVVQDILASKVQLQTLELSLTNKIKIGGLGKYIGFTHIDIRKTPELVQWIGSRGLGQTL